jgi:hypothetical protein
VAETGATLGAATRTAFRPIVLATLVALLLPSPAFALIDIYHTDNNIPIGSYPGWTGGDPG